MKHILAKSGINAHLAAVIVTPARPAKPSPNGTTALLKMLSHSGIANFVMIGFRE